MTGFGQLMEFIGIFFGVFFVAVAVLSLIIGSSNPLIEEKIGCLCFGAVFILAGAIILRLER